VRGWGRVALAFLHAHLLIIGICAGLLLLYTLAGFFLVPRLARSQLESFVTETLHQRIAIGELRFNPFTFEASANSLRLTEPSGRDLVGFRHLYVDAELASLWQRAIVMKEVELAAPSVQLIVNRDGSVNLSSLRPPVDEESTADAKSKDDAAPTPVRIGKFSMIEGRVAVEDHTRDKPFVATIAPIRFSLSDFKTDAGHRNGYQFAGTTSSGERLDWQGGFTVQPLGSTGQFSVSQLHVKTLESYLEQSLPFRLVSGDANLSGGYRFDLEPLALDITLPTLAIRNLALAEHDEPTHVPIQVADIELQQLVFSLAKRDLRVQNINVRGARIDVAREADGTLSLDRLFATQPDPTKLDPTKPDNSSTPDAPPAPPHTTSPATSSWHAAIDTLRIENATLVAEDRAVQPTARFELSALNASITDWHNGADAKLQLALDVGINGTGKLAANGSVQLEPLSAVAKIDLARLDLVALQPYVASSAQMTIHSGALDVKGEVRFDAANPEQTTASFAGDVRVADFRTTDNALKQDFIKWRDLAITGIAYQHAPASLAIERITASQPYANVVIAENGSLNVSQVLTGPSNVDQATAKTTEPRQGDPPSSVSSSPMAMSVRLVQVENGSANFADRSIEPSFATKIVGLRGKVTGLSSKASSRAKVSLNGKVDDYAPVDITGDVNVLAAAKYSDLAMSFRNMELTTFNPYSGKFAGYSISKGKLTTELKYRIENRKLQADHHIVVDNLEFGAKTDSKDAAPIPIKLGVALLKDRNGVIDVNLPVAGTLDDPKFRLGPIIWKAVLGLLTKIVTAPFAALGALFGGGDELAYLDFPAGSAMLSASEATKLDKLAKALAERPVLRLDVPIASLTTQDSAALATNALAERIPDDASADSKGEAAERKRLQTYEKAYKELLKESPAYPEALAAKDTPIESKRAWLEAAMLAKLQPDPSALDALARDRARAVQAALLTNTGIEPERIFITTDRKAAATPEGAVRMELKLE
jgi:uncharacterized protein involved in outer membrane biogenesis